MATHLIYRRPNVVGGDTVDLTEFTGRKGTPFFDGDTPLMELGMRYDDASATQGTFRFMSTSRDPEDEPFATSFPLGHCLVTLVEDEMIVNSSEIDGWLFRGRVATGAGGRGVAISGGEMDWTITVEDGNVELRGQAFTVPWERPSETDTARLYALQEYTLAASGSTAAKFRETCNVNVSSAHLAPDTNTVTMPAKTYAVGTQPADVVRDCAEMAGKLYGVVIHHEFEDEGVGSHLCLLYILPTDHTTYASAAKISDVLADWDPEHATAPVFEPHWEQGSGTTYQYQTILSGMIITWSPTDATFIEDSATIDQYDYWVDGYQDSLSENSTQSAARAVGLLDSRQTLHVSHAVSVIVNPEQTGLLAAGMSIEVKTIVTADPTETYLVRRIAECRWEPMIDGRYKAHLQLVRPPLIRVPSGGSLAGVVGNQVSVLNLLKHAHIDAEVPAGTIDGANDEFTLTLEPDPPESLQLYKNGFLQREGSGNDYVLVADTITYEAGTIPETGDNHIAFYRTGG